MSAVHPATAESTVDGVALAPGRWTVDPGHAEVTFVGRHFGLTKVRGRFTGIDGSVDVEPDIDASVIEVTIDVASVESGSADRDDHLRSSDLFDIATFPTATFRSTAIHSVGVTGTIDGDLTIKGVTRPVTLDVEFLGTAIDPSDNERAVFSASTVINREDFGVSWNVILDAGGLMVSKEIRLEIDLELIRV